jgi:hypothetical protein
MSSFENRAAESLERRDKYRKFSERHAGIPLFSRGWWLDGVAGETGWDVALVERGGTIVAALPYIAKRRLRLRIVTQPPLTQSLGPWLADSDVRSSTRLAFEKDAMGELVAQLPQYDRFVQNWHYSRTNWLPFYWQGFRQTTKYTYVLKDLSDQAALWSGLQANIRGDIRKAESRYALRVREDLPLSNFVALNRMTFSRQGKSLPYSETLVRSLDNSCVRRGARKILIAVDEQGRPHAGVYIVWSERSAYYLIGGGDPELRSSGATSLCMWEAIKFASTVAQQFDFEGSMLEPVERFFRAFGAEQVPYFNVYKNASWLLRLGLAMRDA